MASLTSSIRSNGSETALNEAVALELLSAAGLTSQEAVPTGFSVNGSDSVLRLAIEDPEDHWMAQNFEGAGALYKAEATGDWSYRGDDPEAYDEVFDQEAGDDVTDLHPSSSSCSGSTSPIRRRSRRVSPSASMSMPSRPISR